jgi:ABC-type antimicrobial peptide transport system permease subunit
MYIAYAEGKEQELISYLTELMKDVYGIESLEYSFLKDDVNKLYDEDRKVTTIYNIFAVVAIIISCLGLFGISLFDIRQRYREIGIRKVNGAKIKDLYRLLFRKYVVVLVTAFVVAIPIAYYLITLYTQDFVVKAPIGIGIFIIALLVVSIISLGTLFWQVHKAANINPADVVKSE